MKKVIFLLTILFILEVVNANAALIVYSNGGTWQSNVTGIVTDDFNALSGNEYQTLTLGSVTFDVPGNSGDLWVSSPGSYQGLGSALVGNHLLTSIRATFAGGTTAVGSDIYNLTVNDTITVDLYANGLDTLYSIPIIFPNATFFGVTTDTGTISSITFTPGQSWVGIDNFEYGSAGTTPVPEPASMLLLGLGLMGLAGVRRKLKK
jgi:hypothetical protein